MCQEYLLDYITSCNHVVGLLEPHLAYPFAVVAHISRPSNGDGDATLASNWDPFPLRVEERQDVSIPSQPEEPTTTRPLSISVMTPEIQEAITQLVVALRSTQQVSTLAPEPLIQPLAPTLVKHIAPMDQVEVVKGVRPYEKQ